MSISSLILFSLAVVGMTNIIVDPATIMKPLRDLLENKGPKWLNKLVSCYQCTGTWVGFLCGYLLISQKPFEVFMCGMAGSFIATISATYMNYLEVQSIVSVED